MADSGAAARLLPVLNVPIGHDSAARHVSGEALYVDDIDADFSEAVLVVGLDAAVDSMLNKTPVKPDIVTAARAEVLYDEWRGRREREVVGVERSLLADALRDQARGYAGKRRADAVRVVSDVGDAIRDTGAGFDGLPQVKAFFDQAALGVDGLAEDMSRRSFGEMYDEVRAAARRRPVLTAAAAMLGYPITTSTAKGRSVASRTRAPVTTASVPSLPTRKRATSKPCSGSRCSRP